MLRATGRPTWQTIVGGSRAYVEAICARLGDRTRFSSPVASVRRTGDGAVDVTVAGRARMRFDEVVLACHADEALALLADPTPAETAVLGAIAYQRSVLVLHIENRRRDDGAVDFDATLNLRRQQLTERGLRAFVARHPAGSLRVLTLIYGHALALALRGAPHYSRPRPAAPDR